jgi:hypothetical protein
LFGAALLVMDCPSPRRVAMSCIGDWALGQQNAAQTGRAPMRATYDLWMPPPMPTCSTPTLDFRWAGRRSGARRQNLPPYRVDANKLRCAKPDVIVMHVLPAHRGEEITDSASRMPHSALFDQAENRLHAQKGILVGPGRRNN